MLTFYIIIIIYLFILCPDDIPAEYYISQMSYAKIKISPINFQPLLHLHTLCDYTTKLSALTSPGFYNPTIHYFFVLLPSFFRLFLRIPAAIATNKNRNGVVIGCSTLTNACLI